MINIDLQKIKADLRKGQVPSELEVSQLCANAKELLVEEPNLVPVNAPVTVVGNLHGQFEDLLKILDDHGEAPATNYLFLGGYVNRGHKGLEVLMYILAMKVANPDRVILLRSNHESREITQSYGFYDECCKKYGSLNVWRDCTDVFECLPLAACIDARAFAVNGGLSPDIVSMTDIQKIDRKRDVPSSGAFCNLLWSDPQEADEGWLKNDRGQGMVFGESEFDMFMRNNKLEKMYRSHEMCLMGYKQIFGGKLTTVWSAPNYCGKCDNLGAVLKIDDQLKEEFFTFKFTPHRFKVNMPKMELTSFFNLK